MNETNNLAVGFKVLYRIALIALVVLLYTQLGFSPSFFGAVTLAWVVGYLRASSSIADIKGSVVSLVENANSMMTASKDIIAGLEKKLEERKTATT